MRPVRRALCCHRLPYVNVSPCWQARGSDGVELRSPLRFSDWRCTAEQSVGHDRTTPPEITAESTAGVLSVPLMRMLIGISDTPANERGPRHTKAVLAAIHKATSNRTPVSFVYGSHAGAVGLYVRFPDRLAPLIKGQFHAKYPDCQIDPLPEKLHDPPPDHIVRRMTLRLTPELFPLVRYQQYEDAVQTEIDDPVGGVLQAIAPGGSPVQARIEIRVIPASRRRTRAAQRAVERLTTRSFFRERRRAAAWYAQAVGSQHRVARIGGALFALAFARKRAERGVGDELDKSSSRLHDSEKDLQAAAVKLGHHLFEAELSIMAIAPPEFTDDAERKLHEIAAVLHKFTVPRLATWESLRMKKVQGKGISRGRGFLLSDEELATLWHLPTKGVRDANRQTNVWRRLEPPAELPLKEREQDVCELGRICFQERSERFGIRTEDRFRHLFICGKTGNGKSTVLLNAIVSDMQAGRGVAVVDPHGDLADTVLASVPSHRTNDVIVIDPSDIEYPVSINPLDVAPDMAALACDGMVSTFDKVFGTGTHTPQLHDILWNTTLALMLAGETSLVDVLRMLGPDEAFRADLLGRVNDPVVLHWWETEFPLLKARQGGRDGDPFASLKNKLRQLLTTPVIRHIVAQTENRVDFRRAMDEGKILIVNLSKGKLGEKTSAFLGSVIVTQLQLAAMSRANIPEPDRWPFFLYVDEFHNVATSSFVSILSEARKFKLGLCLATQFLDQIDERTLQAVFGNVGSLLVFAVGPNDAEVLATQLAGEVRPTDLIALPKYRAYLRLMIDGVSKPAFSMATIEPQPLDSTVRAVVVREQSRRRYAEPVERVQSRLAESLVRQ